MRPGISAGNKTKDILGARGYFFREIERDRDPRLGDVAPPRISLSISRKKITSGTQGKQKSATSFKMTGHEALLMTSLESILAIFMRRRRSFFQRMRFMSLHMRRIKRNAVKLAIQQQNHIHRRKRKTM